MAMNVPIEADWKSPCTVLVARAEAATVPDSCFDGGLSWMRSRKLVSSRLKAVVCEFAMFPEMFSSANDCARSPVTAVVRAPKIPMTCLRPIEGALTRARSGEAVARRVPRTFCQRINSLSRERVTDDRRETAGCGRICRAKTVRCRDSRYVEIRRPPFDSEVSMTDRLT